MIDTSNNNTQKPENVKTHWKKLTNPNYFGSWDIPAGKKVPVVIDLVKKETVTGAGGEKDDCVVAHLKAHKPLILNATNCKTITKITGSPYIEDWAGITVLLEVQRVRAFGEVVDAVRVVPQKVSLKKPVLEPQTQRWNKAIEALQTGVCDLDLIAAKYDITPENLKKLKGEADAK